MWHVWRRGERGAYRVFVGRPGPRLRCKDNIKVDLQEVGWESMDWIDLTGGGRL
jgi:hypothetical protein